MGELFTGEHRAGKCPPAVDAATRRLRQDRQCDAVEAIPHLASNSAFIELPNHQLD
jgi:hypothetical protein